LAYLEDPYLSENDEEIVVARLSDEKVLGVEGISQIYTALVPLDLVEEVLKSKGRIGWEVESSGPFPVPETEVYEPKFWIDGPSGISFEPLVVGWQDHNRAVMVPDNRFLMTYGLCPRIINENKIAWDDLSKPVYDVVQVKPFSKYSVPNQYSGAEVRIKRKYAEDFASLRQCALVAVFYEERRFQQEDELEQLLDGQEGYSVELSGKRLDIVLNRYLRETPYICRVWGCRLILIPSSRPITDEQDPQLTWPDDSQVMTHDRAMQSSPIDWVYVRDQVLSQFEKRPEFEVDPNSGSVDYEGQWSLCSCHRVGRDYIAYDLKNLYEGCPPDIIENVHHYAVSEKVAKKQRNEEGDINIGTRASTLISEYLQLTSEIARISNQLGFVFEDSDIGTLSQQEVDYDGWWMREDLKSLGWVVRLSIREEDFLERCKVVYKLLEKIQEKSLRKIVQRIGVDQKKIENYRSLKLLDTLMQLVHYADESGLSLKNNAEQICARLEENSKPLLSMSYLFAVNDLRGINSHNISKQNNDTYDKALKIYGISKTAMSNGWGRGLDQIYDKLSVALADLRKMLNRLQ
jgi:hypothetical protein